MSQDKRPIGLDFSVDGTKAEQGFAGVKKSARDMATEVSAQFDKAGQNMDRMGERTKLTAKEQERATKSIVASMERNIAQTKAAGKSTADYYLELAKTRGVDTSTAAFQRLIAEMRTLNAETRKNGLTAKQTDAALRGVPAQFTDIFVSLQGGQAPLTVLLQQGGQLKDMFGGVGAAARAMGGYVMGLVNPFTAAAAAIGGVGLAAYYGAQEQSAYNRALILSGNIAGTTSGQMQMMARAMAEISGTQGAAAEALAIFVQSARVGRDNLVEFTGSAQRFASAAGQEISDLAKNFSDLAKDPLAATLKLNEGMNYLTASTYEQIKSLVEQGRQTEAATMAQKAYSDALADRTPEILRNLSYVEAAWKGVSGAIKGAWDTLKNLGRQDGPEKQLADVQARLADRMESLSKFGNRGGLFGQTTEQQIASLREQESLLQSTVRELQKGVQLKADQAKQVEAMAKWDAMAAKDASDKVKKEREIAAARQLGLEAKKSEGEIAAQVAAIEARYTKKQAGPTGGDGGASELASLQARTIAQEQYLDLLKRFGPEAEKLTEGEKTAIRIRQELLTETNALTRARKLEMLAEAEKLIAAEKAVRVEQDRVKLMQEIDARAQKQLETALTGVDTTNKAADAQERANQTFGLGKSALAELTLAELEQQRAALEQTENVIPGYIKAIELRIEAQKRLIESMKQGEALEASEKAAKTAQEAWKRTADSIERSLTDALMRGFESGKGFAEVLRDTVVNMFKTMVLRPYIQAVVGGIAGTGAAGAAASAAGPLASALPGLASLSGAAGYFGTGIMNTLAGTGTMAGLGAAGSIGGLSGAAMGLGAIAPWALGAAALVKGLSRGSRQITSDNLTGTFSAQGADLSSVQTWTQKGGWLRSNRSGTISSSLQGSALDQSLDATIASMYAKTREYAKVLGLPATAIDGFSQSINISLKGLSAEERDKKIQEALGGFGDALAQTLGAASMDALQQIAERVLSERTSLENQLLQLQGNTAEIRKREREALHETNRALYDQIKALEDQKKAAEAWRQIGDSLMDEVARIRGLVAEESGLGLSYLQAQFASLTAAARAGDQTAGGKLAGVAGAISEAAAKQARSALELAVIRSGLANSLEQTNRIVTGAPSTPSTSILNATASDDAKAMRMQIEELNNRINELTSNTKAENQAQFVALNKLVTIMDNATQGGSMLVRTRSGETVKTS